MKEKNYSTYKLFGLLILSIFAIELFIMFVLSYFPTPEIPHFDNFIDAFILVITVSPLVYFVAIKPLQIKIDELGSAKATIHDLNREREIEGTRTDILALASHQLRTPLSGTKWLIETLRKGIHGPLNERQTEYLDEIYKVNEKMTTLVNDMFAVLRLEEGHGVVIKNDTSVKKVTKEALGLLDGEIKKKKIIIETPGSDDNIIKTNSSLLGNLLQSLLSNAVRYSQEEGRVIIEQKKTPNELVISIKDFGIGIPKDEQKRLFERFYRASNAKTYDTTGTGLGLYIAATLAKKIGATLSFESEEGKGTTFFVHIPYSPSEQLVGK